MSKTNKSYGCELIAKERQRKTNLKAKLYSNGPTRDDVSEVHIEESKPILV